MDFLLLITKPVFWFQPVFYTFHGWLATEMALWLLFHPYEPKFVPGTRLQIPFTPGIFPRGRHKLSISIANTITEILLTKEDIKRQAQKLITEENIYKTIDALAQSVANELKDVGNLRNLYRYADNFMPPLITKLVCDAIESLERGENKQFESVLKQLFNRVIPHLTWTDRQATLIAKTIFDTMLTPGNIRRTLINILTADNIGVLEEGIKGRLGGFQGFLMRFVDIRKEFMGLRQFLMDAPAEAEAIISQLVTRMQLEEKLKDGILKLTPTQLAPEDLEELKSNLINGAKNLLIQYKSEIAEGLGAISVETSHTLINSLLQADLTQVSQTWLPGVKRETAHFVFTYLNKELENMLSKALPAISLNTVIIEKIDQFSARELEQTIQRICHRELRWLAFLGAFLGFWLGLVSNFINAWLHPAF